MDMSLLDSDKDDVSQLMNQLMLHGDEELSKGLSENTGNQTRDGIKFVKLIPTPAYCVKMKTSKKEKVFINVCTSEQVPEPLDLSESELIKQLEMEDAGTGFRIPMSIGEAHAEIDKGGAGCTAYDVVIHPSFLKKTQGSIVFQRFFIQVMREGVEVKYDLELEAESVILKNRKSIGKLLEQNVRTQSKPFILDIGEQEQPSSSPDHKPLIQEIAAKDVKKGPEPKFTIIAEPPHGHPEFLVAEIQLPNVISASTIILDIGEDRILLDTRSNAYFLDIFLPFFLIQNETGAQFHRQSKILTITMAVQPKV